MNDLNSRIADIASDQKVILNQLNTQHKTLESHSEKLEEIGITLLRNTITVELHERRSTSLELLQKADRERIEALEKAHTDQIADKKAASRLWKMIAAISTAVAGLGGALWSIYEFMKKLGL